MLCPYCHNENKFDALTCDFCMHELALTDKRIKEIDAKNKLAKKEKFRLSIIKLIGTLLGVLLIAGIIIFVYFRRK